MSSPGSGAWGRGLRGGCLWLGWAGVVLVLAGTQGGQPTLVSSPPRPSLQSP